MSRDSPIDFVWPPKWLPASDEWKDAWRAAHPELVAVLLSDDPSEAAVHVKIAVVQAVASEWSAEQPIGANLDGEDVVELFDQQRHLDDVPTTEDDDGVHP